MTLLSVYVGNDPTAYTAFESWLGRNADGVHGVVGGATWQDFTSSAQWMVNKLWNKIDDQVFWSVPLIVADGKATLAAAADHDYDAYYLSVARTLAASRADDDGPIYIRTGWEFNGDWFPWSAAGKEADFIGAYRAFVDTFRSVSDRFLFEWNVNESYGSMNPAKAYPGDDYVDIIGMDFYWDTNWNSSNPAEAWESMVSRKYGLAWLEDFASAHGKPTAYSEWGVETDNAAPYLAKVKQWFDSHNVVYQSYWNSDAAFEGKLSDGGLPAAGDAFRSLFGTTGGATDNGAGGKDTVTLVPSVGGSPKHLVTGTAAAENWKGTTGNDQYTSNGGGDTMTGGAGDDIYIVSASTDRVVELTGGGIDTVKTWLNNYVLPGNVENLLLAGHGWTTGTGNALANRITGNDARNTIDGGVGNDFLTGGDGQDSFIIRAGEGSDTIADFQVGKTAGDYIRLEGFGFISFDAVLAVSTQNGADLLIRLGSSQSLTLLGTQRSDLVAENVILPVVAQVPVVVPATPTSTMAKSWVGTVGNDIYTSSGAGDTIKGGFGDDFYIISGLTDRVVELAKGGTDTVQTWINHYVLPDNVENLSLTGADWTTGTGNALANRIIGNDAPNTIDGSAGDDTLTGGKGNDRFILRAGEGSDTITDFHAGSGAGDVIQLQGFRLSSFEDIAAATSQKGGDVIISLGAGQTLTLQHTTIATLHADDFIFNPGAYASATAKQIFIGTSAAEKWKGTAGNDQYTSNGGNDTMAGGTGDDTYVLSSGSDRVVELPGGGIDTVRTWLGRYVLPGNVENLVLTGHGWTTGIGNASANRITGNDAPNTIDGGAGDDILTGGSGRDTFIMGLGDGSDIITDFQTRALAGNNGDLLRLEGFGPGAALTHVDELWKITTTGGAVTMLTLTGVTALSAADYVWS
ncbi:MAG: hypothetical protein JWP04_4171 [Belnapia sp.]|nr:hypothetical protein [Belnapia sp.]